MTIAHILIPRLSTDRSGYPRHWAVHKLWLSARSDRDPQEEIRDQQQADVMLCMIAKRIPQFLLDPMFRQVLKGVMEPGKSSGPTETSWWVRNGGFGKRSTSPF